MKMSLVKILGSFVLTIFLCAQATDEYVITALPNNFFISSKKALNNKGIVAGYMSKKRVQIESNAETFKAFFDAQRAFLNRKAHEFGYVAAEYKRPFPDEDEGARASWWNSDSGQKTIDLTSFKSTADSINDDGFIAVRSCENKTWGESQYPFPCQIFIWNIKKDSLQKGPSGLSCAIDATNTILIPASSDSYLIWNVEDNTLLEQNSYQYYNSVNAKKSTISTIGFKDYVLICDGKKYLLLPPEGQSMPNYEDFCINDNNEVVSIIGGRIIKWADHGKTTTSSDKLYKLFSPNNFSYYGVKSFNNKGQILLEVGSSPSYQRSLFLLTPKKLSQQESEKLKDL